MVSFLLLLEYEFQSTHPVRGATLREASLVFVQANFNPRTP